MVQNTREEVPFGVHTMADNILGFKFPKNRQKWPSNGRLTGAEFGSTSAHQSWTTTAALASGHASCHVQDSHIDAPDLT